MSDRRGSMPRFKVIITDFDYGDNDVERAILEPIGAEVVALQARSEADLLADAADCDAIMNQYARVGAGTIEAMRKCQVIARYGVGVDIVDVEAATKKTSSSPTSATTAPRKWQTMRSPYGWRWCASFSSMTVRPMTACGAGSRALRFIACADARWASSPSVR